MNKTFLDCEKFTCHLGFYRAFVMIALPAYPTTLDHSRHFRLLIYPSNMSTVFEYIVIPAKAGIQFYRKVTWFLRFIGE